MCGYISGVIFAESENWRLVIGSPCIFPVVVCAYVYTLPESPRWLLQAARRSKDQKSRQKLYQKAWRSFERLRRSKIQAARDMFLVYHMLENEEKIRSQHNRFAELFTNPRNRRAIVASTICLFFQQFCGVSVVPCAYLIALTLGTAIYSHIIPAVFSMIPIPIKWRHTALKSPSCLLASASSTSSVLFLLSP